METWKTWRKVTLENLGALAFKFFLDFSNFGFQKLGNLERKALRFKRPLQVPKKNESFFLEIPRKTLSV